CRPDGAPRVGADASPAHVRGLPARGSRGRRGTRGVTGQSAEQSQAGRRMSPRRRICVVTGSRAEYGLLYWVLRALQEAPDVELQLVVTGAHLSAAHGRTVDAIEKDGFPIAARVDLGLEDDSPVGIAKSMGLGVAGFGAEFARLAPD